ncbi:hypothetical protein VTO42DRAFT_3169 [Malbranchea cinnamomea]
MADSLEERLRSHAQAFDGLLSLIPAKYYYGEDTSDQWQRKKQTKEQARNAKRAKLDPDSLKTAKDVLDENAKKRKRDEDGDADEAESGSETSELGSELPREGMKRYDQQNKRLKKDDGKAAAGKQEPMTDAEREERRRQKAEKKAEKKAAKKERLKQKQAEKRERLKQKEEKLKNKDASEVPEGEKETRQEEAASAPAQPADAPKDTTDDDGMGENGADETEEIAPMEGFALDQNAESTASTSPSISHTFDSSNVPSATSSISSIVPPPGPSDTKPADSTQKSETPSSSSKPLKVATEEQKQRLRQKIEELRAKRHADGLNGKPARNRQELMEARRQAEQRRREAKKEQRRRQKEEEQRLRDEAIAKRFSPHGSLLASPGSPADSITSISNNFSFGRVIFADGQQADPTLTSLRDQKKKRGPQDPGTALKAAEAKKARLEAMDEAKRKEIEEKDMWLNAKKKAHGERVKDDISLLKKSLHRKQSMKRRSEKQWKERLEAVAKSKEMRQAKREENLRKRREEKAMKGKKGAKGKARPGFEGSFKAKAGKKK